MQIAFASKSHLEIDRLVAIAAEHMASGNGSRVLYFKAVETDDLDELEEFDDDPEIILELAPASRFDPVPRLRPLPLIAVDSGVRDLGTISGGGIALAIRAAAVFEREGERPLVLKYNTGSLVVDAGNRLQIFHHIGKRLGAPSLLVDVDENGKLHLAAKTPLRSNEVTSTIRSFVEKVVTEEAIGILSSLGGGTLLIDGALPPNSFDLPNSYVVAMLSQCADAGIDVIALSKKTRYTVRGRPISAVFDDVPNFIGYAEIRTQVDSPRVQRGGEYRSITAANEVYATRLAVGPTAMTFRTDIHNSVCSTPVEVVERLYHDIRLYGGYPSALIMAHQTSSVLQGDAVALGADLVARYGLRFEVEPSMSVLFQPFNAFGK